MIEKKEKQMKRGPAKGVKPKLSGRKIKKRKLARGVKAKRRKHKDWIYCKTIFVHVPQICQRK